MRASRHEIHTVPRSRAAGRALGSVACGGRSAARSASRLPPVRAAGAARAAEVFGWPHRTA